MPDIDTNFPSHNSLWCPTCGCTPCCNPSFCAKCREADAPLAAAGYCHAVALEMAGLPPNYDAMSFQQFAQYLLDKQWERFYG